MLLLFQNPCLIKIKNVVAFLVQAYPDCPGKDVIKRFLSLLTSEIWSKEDVSSLRSYLVN